MSALIENWKKTGSYHEGIELIELYAPHHALLPALKTGVSSINWLYIRQAINTLDIDAAKKSQPFKPTKVDTGEIADLYARLKQLYHLKAKRHNDFFDAGTNLARAVISDDLAGFRKEIHQISRKIEHFERTGELVAIPSIASLEEIDLPQDLFRLGRMLANTRSNISKCKKSLDRAFSNKDKAAIEKYEKKKESLEHKLTAIERKIEHIRKEETP